MTFTKAGLSYRIHDDTGMAVGLTRKTPYGWQIALVDGKKVERRYYRTRAEAGRRYLALTAK